MGGKALLAEMPEVKRLNRNDWNKYGQELIQLIGRTLSIYSNYVRLIPSYGSKDDFGDIDLIISRDQVEAKVNWKETIAKAMNSKAMISHPNSNVVTYEYKGHQVDLIIEPNQSFDFALNYYSYNGLGNIMGKLARKLGLKLRPSGLFLEVKDGTHKISEICITTNFYEIFAMLGLDYYKYGRNFNTPTDIYKFVADSKVFSKEVFTTDLNHADRTRDLKNPIYAGFLEYINAPTVTNKYDFQNGTPPGLQNLFKKNYGHVIAKFKEIMYQHNLDKEVKSKFNGDIVKEATGMPQGPDLGEFMKAFKLKHSPERFSQYILATSVGTLKKDLLAFYEVWSKAYAKLKAEALKKLQKEEAKIAKLKKGKGEAQLASVANP